MTQDLDSIVLKREVGSDILDNAANFIRGSFYDSVEEFVANAFDADARTFRITYQPDNKNLKESVLIFEDDGHGMDAYGLESFFRAGDSPKKKK